MKKIIAYEVFLLICLIVLMVMPIITKVPDIISEHGVLIKSVLYGGIGGVLYCLRAVYLNKCVHKCWDEDWQVWYYVRPIVSLVSGLMSFIFLKAGLLVLDASSSNANAYGFYALAFIAGYNVDNFLKKIESLSKELWGIHPSKANEDNKSGESKDG